jgi:hypothetical protein
MNAKKLVAGAAASVVAALAVGLTGCDSGSGEIPLAKVPPPPADFGKAAKNSKAPRDGSPLDTSKYTK